MAEAGSGRAVTAADLIKVLEKDARLISNYSAAPAFLLFVILYSVSCTMSYDLDSRGAVRRMQVSVREEVFREEEFKEIQEASGFYAWLRGVVQKNLFCQGQPCVKEGLALGASAGISTSDNMALSFLLLRQHRQDRSSNYCRNKQLFPLNDALRLRIQDQGCAAGYLDVDLSETPYGSMPASLSGVVSQTTDPFQPDSAKGSMPRMHWVEGDDTHYGDRDQQFSLVLPFDLQVANVTSVIDAMETGGWIDDATKAVFLVVQFVNPAKGEYAVFQFVLEFSITGETGTKVNALPFAFFLKGENALRGFLFALDILFVIYLIFILMDLVRGCVLNARLEMFPLGLVEMLYVVQFILLAVALGMRFQLWREGDAFRGNMNSVEMFTELNEYAFFYGIEHTCAAVSLGVTWVRVLEQLRFTKQLNSVTETLRLGAPDLFSLFIVFALIVLGFATSGQQHFGYHVEVFENLGKSIRFLTEVTFTGDLTGGGVLDEMVAVKPWLTLLFMGTFTLLSWLLLLNIVLGILAAAFSAATATTEDRRWTCKSLMEELSAPFCTVADDEHDELEATFGVDGKPEQPGEESWTCGQRCWHCIWPFLFLNNAGRRNTDSRIEGIRLLRSLCADEEVPAKVLEISDETMDKLKARGWNLNPSATVDTVVHATQRVPDDFAQLAEDKNEQITRVISDVLINRSEVLTNRQELMDVMIERTEALETLVLQILSRMGEQDRKMSSHLTHSKDMESSLRKEVHISKDEMGEKLRKMGEQVSNARRELLKELTNEGQRLLENVGDMLNEDDDVDSSSSPPTSPEVFALPSPRMDSGSTQATAVTAVTSGAQNLATILLKRAARPGIPKERAEAMKSIAGALKRTVTDASVPSYMRRTISSIFQAHPRSGIRRSSSLPDLRGGDSLASSQASSFRAPRQT
eukprot:Hpha_TRINITY_DN16172_c0_g2::TRINITY_DN16172_c0_g2_i2::g.7789::m.7789